MIIRNKFNGYSRDGVRLYFDPATILALSQAAGAAGTTAAATTAAAAPTIAATTAAAAPTIAAAAAPTIASAAAPSVAQTAALEASKQGIIQGAAQQQAAQAGLGQAAAQTGGSQAVGASNLAAQGPGSGIMTDAGVRSTAPEILGIKPGGTSVADAEALNAQILQAQNANPNFVSGGPTPVNVNQTVTAPPTAGPPAPPAFRPTTQANAATSDSMTKALQQSQSSSLSDKALGSVTPAPAGGVPANISDAEIAAKVAESQINPLEKGIQTGVNLVKKYPLETGATLMLAGQYLNRDEPDRPEKYKSSVNMSQFRPSEPTTGTYTPIAYAVGGPVEQMAAMNSVGANTGYPMAQLQTPLYANPVIQRPEATNVISPSSEPAVGTYSGEQKFREGGISEATAREYGLKTRKQRATRGLMDTYEGMEKDRVKTMAEVEALGRKFDVGISPRSRTQQLSGGFSAAQKELESAGKRYKVPVAKAPKTSLGDLDDYMNTPIEAARGGIMGDLGSYSDGGRLLRGPGDGVSDSIPAVIGKRQPARLADGEFVIPARIVSELGNGSTEAGARKLYAMMERIQSTRRKSIGKKKVAVNSRADKHLPA